MIKVKPLKNSERLPLTVSSGTKVRIRVGVRVRVRLKS
jgi:hypothetical protein